MKEVKVTTDTTEIQSSIRNCYEQLYTKKMDNLGEMEKFLETYNLLKLNQEAETLKKPITTSEIEAAIKKLPAQKSPRMDGCTSEFLPNILLKLFQKKFKKREDSQTLFTRPVSP